MAKLEKKIFLDRADDLDKAVNELISASAERVILNIPNNSVLSVSVHNFQILAREGETSGKELAIESVDEKVLELASLARIPAVNPVFKTREVVVTDILPRLARSGTAEGELAEEKKPARKAKAKTKAEKPGKKESKAKTGRKKKEPEKKEVIPITIKEEKRPELEIMEDIIPRGKEPEELVEYIPDFEIKGKPVHKKSKRNGKFWAITSVSLIVFAGVVYALVVYILPKATISISIKKTTIPFANTVIVDTNVNAPVMSGNIINLPGQLSVAKNNLSMNFPATGSSTVSTKAGGTLTIYNNYSAQAQILIANTRFESPEGKIFRLTSKITIPGAKIVSGKMMPSSIDVKVVADQTGPDYNVPSSQNWQIPGFKGTPRYGKFYAEAKVSMTGGALGNQMIPTLQDLEQGKIKIESALSDSLKSQTLILNSQNLKFLDNTSAFSITTENISSQVDKDGNFSIFAAGELRQLGFDENTLRNTLVKFLSTSTAEVKIDDFSINYGTSTVNLINGKMTFSVKGTLVHEPKIDFDDFKNSILGLDANALKMTVFALPGLQKANISFWPFWVNSVPKRASQVNMTVE
ncbi:hypothetical protein D4R51_02540 [bacterium]|nr:MAG: hypothetical protein D4R51_02540 [bacterium]